MPDEDINKKIERNREYFEKVVGFDYNRDAVENLIRGLADSAFPKADVPAGESCEKYLAQLSPASYRLLQRIVSEDGITWDEPLGNLMLKMWEKDREKLVQDVVASACQFIEENISYYLATGFDLLIYEAWQCSSGICLKKDGYDDKELRQHLPSASELDEYAKLLIERLHSRLELRGPGGSKREVSNYDCERLSEEYNKHYPVWQAARRAFNKTYGTPKKRSLPKQGLSDNSWIKSFKEQFPEFDDLPENLVELLPETYDGEPWRLALLHAAKKLGIERNLRKLQEFRRKGERSLAEQSIAE